MAFNDIDPKAPTHVLIVPTLHVENAGALALMSPTLTADIFTAVVEIAAEKGLTSYRTVFNTRAEAGRAFPRHLQSFGRSCAGLATRLKIDLSSYGAHTNYRTNRHSHG